MKWLVFCVSCFSFAVALTSLRSLAQDRPNTPKPAFAVVSVKATKDPNPRNARVPQFLPGGRFASKGPLIWVIATAYRLPLQGNNRLSGDPDSIRNMNEIYDIEATSGGDTIPDGLSQTDREDRLRSMLQLLLADRFKLVIHRETKEMPIYALAVGKGGPKLQKAGIEERDCRGPEADPASDNVAPEGTMINTPQATPVNPVSMCHVIMGGRGRGIHTQAASMADVASFVENWTNRPLVDKTGLKGLYHIDTLGWLPMELGPPPASGTKAEDGREMVDIPTLFDVLGGLGLKLESQKAKVDIYVIDHIERPSEN